jgi:proteasome component ECM29
MINTLCINVMMVSMVDESSHVTAAVTSVEITRFATDRIKSLSSDIVPLIYFGEHDPDEQLKKLWQDAWENLTSGKCVRKRTT